VIEETGENKLFSIFDGSCTSGVKIGRHVLAAWQSDAWNLCRPAKE
jgi:hypothetical protein